MTPIDPSTLPGIPAPFWFVEFFKVLGFVLHMFAMNLWFAGLPLALLAFVFGTKNSKRLATRLFSQLPIIMALGINFGIVPLLFIQTVYYKMFYSATILMAWHWIMVIPLMIFAYYGLYVCAFSLKPGGNPKYLLPFGLISMFSLLTVAYILVNAMSLMGRPEIWDTLWQKNQVAGATLGLGINSSDPTLWLRYGSMFGLALVTSSVWIFFDSQCLIRKTEDKNQTELDCSYRSWTKGYATFFAWVGTFVLGGCFWGYLTQLKVAPATMEWVLQPIGTALSWTVLGLPAFIAVLFLICGRKKVGAVILIHLQVVALAVFGVFRQWIQNLEVSQIVPVAKIPESVQWSPLITFLVVFVIGAVTIGWMIRQAVVASATKSFSVSNP